MRRGLLGILVVAVMLAAGAPAGAQLLGRSTAMHVSPGSGGIHTSFQLRFAIPEATGSTQVLNRADSVVVNGPSHPGCVSRVAIPLRSAAAHHTFQITLNPAHLNGHWCGGTFTGRLVETEAVTCYPGPVVEAIMCPDIVIAPRTLGHFTFTVTAPPQSGKLRT